MDYFLVNTIINYKKINFIMYKRNILNKIIEKQIEIHQNEIILKSEPEYNYNYDNIPFEIKDNNPFEVQNTRIGNESSLSKKEANTQDSIRYSVIESSHDEAKDLENIYIIAEAEMLEQEKKSSQN